MAPGSGRGIEGSARHRYHHGDLRRALIAAALELIIERGPRGFTLNEAARRAGVSGAAPYRHFTDRQALLRAVAEEASEQLRQALAQAAEATADPLERLIGLGNAYVRWAVANPDQFQLTFGPDGADPDVPPTSPRRPAFALFADAIAECQAKGILAGRDPRYIAAPAWALVHGIASLYVGGGYARAGINEPIGDLTNRSIKALLGAPTIAGTSRSDPGEVSPF
jgi:AcrR family transcriptional regulator